LLKSLGVAHTPNFAHLAFHLIFQDETESLTKLCREKSPVNRYDSPRF
jgi:hypothetical protein